MMSNGKLAALLSTGILAATAGAQDAGSGRPGPPAEGGVTETVGGWEFQVLGSGQYRFSADIDGAGDGNFSMTRAAGQISATTQLDLDSTLSLTGTFGLDSYDINDADGLVEPEPWDDIYTVTLSAAYRWQPMNDFAIGLGPIVQFAWESGADFYQGFKGGGFLFASWEASSSLTIGGGLSVITQIEKTEDIFPIVILNWEIDDNLRLKSTQGISAIQSSGVELIYDIDDKLSIAFGGGFEDREFRLDDEGIPATPIRGTTVDGVGQHTGNAIWARLHYQPNPTTMFYARGGVYTSGELQLEDDGGNDVAEQDHDDQFFLGAGFRIRF